MPAKHRGPVESFAVKHVSVDALRRSIIKSKRQRVKVCVHSRGLSNDSRWHANDRD